MKGLHTRRGIPIIFTMNLAEALDAALREGEQIRARHDGVHAIHSCVCTLQLLRTLARNGDWYANTEAALNVTLQRMRIIDRTGFDPILPAHGMFDVATISSDHEEQSYSVNAAAV